MFDFDDIVIIIFLFVLLFLLIHITNVSDKKIVQRHENFINSYRDDLIVYDECFEYDDKFYCYKGGVINE